MTTLYLLILAIFSGAWLKKTSQIRALIEPAQFWLR
jgi:hypothetical protein